MLIFFFLFFSSLNFLELSYVYIRNAKAVKDKLESLNGPRQFFTTTRLSATRYRKSFSLYSTRLDRLLSSADNTFSRRSRIVPCSLKRVSSRPSIPFSSYRLFHQVEEKLFQTKLEKLD